MLYVIDCIWHFLSFFLYLATLVLAQGDSMPEYRWQSGGDWHQRQWTAALPTDAQILMHCFCMFMDDVFPTLSFSGRHFAVWREDLGSECKPS